MVFDFMEGGADDEQSVDGNRESLRNIWFVPRVMRDVRDTSTATDLWGRRLSLPVILAPTGLTRVVSRHGEVAVARAAEASGTVSVLSSMASYSLEEVAARGAQGHWFQLSIWRDRSLVDDLVRRAHEAGYSALCVTVDCPVVGNRVRDRQNGFTIPLRPSGRLALETLRHPGWLVDIARRPRLGFGNIPDPPSGKGGVVSAVRYMNEHLVHPGATWQDLERVRAMWDGPLVVKGILAPEDAAIAASVGADAIAVSNHGGRQLDGAIPPLHALPAIREAVGSAIKLFVDGGVRTGGDVVKCLALGADACLVGRPFWYGLAVEGEAGVRRVLTILNEEIDRTLALVGCRDVADVDGACVRGHVPGG